MTKNNYKNKYNNNYIYVCVNHLNRCKTSNFPVFKGRGVRHDCGTALNEATTIMGYWV